MEGTLLNSVTVEKFVNEKVEIHFFIVFRTVVSGKIMY